MQKHLKRGGWKFNYGNANNIEGWQVFLNLRYNLVCRFRQTGDRVEFQPHMPGRLKDTVYTTDVFGCEFYVFLFLHDKLMNGE